MYCLGCKKEHEDTNWIYRHGWYCSKYHHPSRPEFMPERVKDDRKEFFNSIVQPYRDGKVAKEYVEVYGTQGIRASEEEIRDAKYQWKDVEGWNSRNKSK